MSTTRRRILFVDDEPMILRGLRNGLRRHHTRWDMIFAESGEAALAELAGAPVDVVVSDMRMPRMDGVALLQTVRRLHPQTARILLTGYADPTSIVSVVSVAHQLLGKPCGAAALAIAIERACDLHDLIADPRTRAVAARFPDLPGPPDLYHHVSLMLTYPQMPIDDIAATLERDPVTRARVLALCSPTYGCSRTLTGAAEAMVELGPELIGPLVLASHAWATIGPADGIDLDDMKRHGLAIARLVSTSPDRATSSDAFAAALVHDLGSLLLARYCPVEYAAILARVSATGLPRVVVEHELIGTTHDALAAFVLEGWGVGLPIVDAVAHHNDDGTPGSLAGAIAAAHAASSTTRMSDSHPIGIPMHKSHSVVLAAFLVAGMSRVAAAQAPVDPPAPAPAPASSPTTAPVAPAAPDAPTPPPAPPPPAPKPDDFDLATVGLNSEAAFDDKLNIYGFADIAYQAVHFRTPSQFVTDTRGFSVGNLNVYLAKNLTRRWRTLAEVRLLFAPNGSTNPDGSITNTTTEDVTDLTRNIDWGGIRIERVYLEYDVTPKLTIRVGHWLSPYGIWNMDHGSPAIITARRPFVIGAEFIPEHQTGIDAFGATYVGDYRIGYHATISNGRSPAEAIEDPDNTMAFGGRLELGAPWSGNATFGLSVYRGRATNLAPNVVTVPVSYDEVAYAADVEWHHGGLLAQGEIMARDLHYRVGQRPAVAGGFQPDGRDVGGYALAGYRLDRMWNVMPFALYEHYDPLTALLYRDVSGYSVGVNLRPTATVVLKAEATLGLTNGAGAYGALGTIYVYTTQAAWVF